MTHRKYEEPANGRARIVDLQNTVSARAFAVDEPNCQAGVSRDVLLRRSRSVS
jgi:hypothetical protein